MKATLYKHPEGEGRIQLCSDSFCLEIFNETTGQRAYAVIGPQGLREFAYELLSLVGEEEHSS